jgi:archaellum biogenesis protein FlaJ (TadC family)
MRHEIEETADQITADLAKASEYSKQVGELIPERGKMIGQAELSSLTYAVALLRRLVNKIDERTQDVEEYLSNEEWFAETRYEDEYTDTYSD